MSNSGAFRGGRLPTRDLIVLPKLRRWAAHDSRTRVVSEIKKHAFAWRFRARASTTSMASVSLDARACCARGRGDAWPFTELEAQAIPVLLLDTHVCARSPTCPREYRDVGSGLGLVADRRTSAYLQRSMWWPPCPPPARRLCV